MVPWNFTFWFDVEKLQEALRIILEQFPNWRLISTVDPSLWRSSYMVYKISLPEEQPWYKPYQHSDVQARIDFWGLPFDYEYFEKAFEGV